MKNASAVLLLFAGWVPSSALVCGCISHHVETAPIELKPIHITMDINLRVQRELDEFFDFEEPADRTVDASPDPTGRERP